MPPSKKNHLIASARKLFESEGFNATGIDRILEAAGVAKMTLYNNFGSKDMLIVAVLNDTSFDILNRLTQSVAHLNDPYEQILGIFDALAEWHDSEEFCGCMFQAAVAEFPDPESEPSKAAQMHLIRLTELFKGMCIRAELEDAITLSSMLAMIASGANCAARQIRTNMPAKQARQIAEILLERACARRLTTDNTPF